MSEQKPTRINPESLASKQNLADKLREVYSELGQHYGYIGVLELAADEIDRLTAREDDNDGYRSCMRDLTEGGKVHNQFAPQRVLCSLRTEGEYGSKDETLVMRDVVTGKEVLEVGTDNTDDYYPSFVANFRPENMAINSQTTV